MYARYTECKIDVRSLGLRGEGARAGGRTPRKMSCAAKDQCATSAPAMFRSQQGQLQRYILYRVEYLRAEYNIYGGAYTGGISSIGRQIQAVKTRVPPVAKAYGFVPGSSTFDGFVPVS